MNALVAFRANAAGILSATQAQRAAARETVMSNHQAAVAGLARAKSATTASATAAKNAEYAATEAADNELGRDAFLQLLVLQMRNQDPTEPVDNQDMIAQLAQFSSLEEMENLNSSFETVAENIALLTGNIDQLNFINAQGLIGKYVEGVGGDGEAVTGMVEAVHLSGSIVWLTVEGEVLPMTNVLSVSETAPEAGTGEESSDGQ